MIKKIAIILVALLPVLNMMAQRTYLPTAEDLNHFKKTKTYVVLHDNPMSDYNFDIKDAVEKFWDITEYEFLDFAEFEEKSKDPDASFLYEAKVNFENDKSAARYMFLCLSLGSPDRNSPDELRDITNIPLAYFGSDEDEYSYKLGTLLRFMQNHVSMLIKDPAMVAQNVFQVYNDNMGDLSGKTMYLVQDEIVPEMASVEKIREIYPYPFRFATRDEIKELILNKDENAVFLHKVGPGTDSNSRVYKVLVGAADAKFYYYNYHKASKKKPDAILMNDFRRISQAQQ